MFNCKCFIEIMFYVKYGYNYMLKIDYGKFVCLIS